MQSASWYVYRLRAMSLAEVWWRMTAAGRDGVDAGRVALGVWPSDPHTDGQAEALAAPAAPRLCDMEPGAWGGAEAGSIEFGWRHRLVGEAESIARHRVRIFGREVDLGTPIDWNRDHFHGISTPLTRSAAIDYRDRRVGGDAKVVWEPNRHQHLVVLARAYRATGERRYAAAAVEQLTSWLEQCPVGRGMNWRSPLELAIRLISWTWTIDLIRDSGCLDGSFCRRLATAVHLHLWDITRKFSSGSSANNHLIGEAAGVFVASCYFSEFRDSAAWRAASADILTTQIVAQTHDDGGTREQAMAYHLFVLQLHLVAGVTGRQLGHDLPAPFWTRLERMVAFASHLAEGGPLPAFGDADDGYALDLGRSDGDLAGSLCAGAVLFGRPEFKRLCGGLQEPVRWLFGAEAGRRFAEVGTINAPPLQSRSLAGTGYYVLQSGTPGPSSGVSVVVDGGELGFTAIAAHGHADSLSVHARAFGHEVFVDAGTFDYFTYPEWREYFRSTRAHNTVTIDELDQSAQLGLFLWGARAETSCLSWGPQPDGGSVTVEHDGYCRLSDPVRHRRTVCLSGSEPTLEVRDELFMRAAHDIAVFFHLAPGCEVAPVSGDSWPIRFGPHTAWLQLDPALAWEVIHGAEHPIGGWVSRGYHHRLPAATIKGTCRHDRDLAIVTQARFVANDSSMSP